MKMTHLIQRTGQSYQKQCQRKGKLNIGYWKVQQLDSKENEVLEENFEADLHVEVFKDISEVNLHVLVRRETKNKRNENGVSKKYRKETTERLITLDLLL